MTENPHVAPEASLYGSVEKNPAPKPPSLMDQFVGVFTEPSALFDRLHSAPSWISALVLTTIVALCVSGVWLAKVDLDAMLRPILERIPNIPADRLDAAIDMQKKFVPVFSIGVGLFGPMVIAAILAFVYWMIGKASKGLFILSGIFITLELISWGLSRLGPQPRLFMPIAGSIFLIAALWFQFSNSSPLEDQPPSFLQSFSAAIVPGLVMLPHSLLIIVMAFAKNVGGLTPEKLPPTSVGYFVEVTSIKAQAALYAIDLFTIALLGLSYLAFRRTLRFRPLGALLATIILALFMVGGQISRAQ